MNTSSRDLLFNAGFALALAVLAAVGWLSYRDMKAMSESDTLETHTYTVIHEMDGLLSALMDAEAGPRGFVITNDDRYLETYNNALVTVDAKLASLKSLARDDPRQQERLRVIEPLVRDMIARLKEIVQLQRTRGHEAASYAVMSNLDKSLMDQIRKHVADAQDEESRLLRERAAAKAAATRRTVEAVAVGAILSFALLLAVFVLLRKEISQRVIAEGELRVHRDRLEELVQEKTQDVGRQRELLRVTLSSIGDAVLATDTAGRITFLNPMAAAMTGWQEEQALGQPVQSVLRIMNERTPQRAEDIVARALGEGGVVTLADHTGLLARDGRETPIEDSAAPIKDSAGHVIGAVLVFHDVTEKRRAHESLLAAEERFRLLFQQAAVGIKRLDRQGRLLEVNDKLCDILGYSREELLRLSLKDITHAEDLPLEQAKLSMLLSRQSPTYSIEKRCLRKDGNVIWVRVTASLPAGAQGELDPGATIRRYRIVRQEGIGVGKPWDQRVQPGPCRNSYTDQVVDCRESAGRWRCTGFEPLPYPQIVQLLN